MKAKSTQSTRLTALEARQAELERRIAELERAAMRQMPKPWTPSTPQDDIDWPPIPTTPPPPHPWYPQPSSFDPRCHICKNRYADMTHYVCNNDQCPNRIIVTCDTKTGPSIAPGVTFGGESIASDQLPHFAGSTTQAVGQTPEHLK